MFSPSDRHADKLARHPEAADARPKEENADADAQRHDEEYRRDEDTDMMKSTVCTDAMKKVLFVKNKVQLSAFRDEGGIQSIVIATSSPNKQICYIVQMTMTMRSFFLSLPLTVPNRDMQYDRAQILRRLV